MYVACVVYKNCGCPGSGSVCRWICGPELNPEANVFDDIAFIVAAFTDEPGSNLMRW